MRAEKPTIEYLHISQDHPDEPIAISTGVPQLGVGRQVQTFEHWPSVRNDEAGHIWPWT